jgi:hypothetical protein
LKAMRAKGAKNREKVIVDETHALVVTLKKNGG